MHIRKQKTLRDKVEEGLGDLASHTEDLRQQVVERAPAVRDQILAALPDKEQLVDLRDDLFDKLPADVQEKLPERVKPKRKRLRKVATLGVLTGAGAAAFAIVKRRNDTPPPYTPPAPRPPSTTAPSTATTSETTPPEPPAPPTDGDPFTAEPRLN